MKSMDYETLTDDSPVDDRDLIVVDRQGNQIARTKFREGLTGVVFISYRWFPSGREAVAAMQELAKVSKGVLASIREWNE